MDFDIFFLILIFAPKGGFCKRYSFSMDNDFRNALISGIIRVFWSGFFKRTTLKDLYNGF